MTPKVVWSPDEFVQLALPARSGPVPFQTHRRYGKITIPVPVGALAKARFINTRGVVNARPVRFDGFIALAETLLFCDATYNPLGADTLNIGFFFRADRGKREDGHVGYIGWNRLYDTAAERWLPRGVYDLDANCFGEGDIASLWRKA